MPSEFERWCRQFWGRMPVTPGEIYYSAKWFEADRAAARAAQEELASIETVDDLLSAGR